jgi:membrane-bound lytic murein transglycosylase D
MYIFEYHKEHGIVPNKAIANHFATDTIMVKRHMSFKQISDLLDISVDELKFYNPSYKRQEVPYISGEQNFIRLPKSKVAVFTSNEDKIYAYVDYEEKNREKPFAIAKTTSNKSIDTLEKPETDKEFVTRYKFHKVKRGENIYDVALKYGVTANNIRDWNNLKGSKVSRGKTLKIVTTERIAYKQNKKEKPETTDIASVENPTSKVAKTYKLEKVTTNKQVTKYHKVKRGDNLSEIASKYDVDVSEIKKWNKIKDNNLIAGKSLKIVKTEQVTKTIKKEVLVPTSIDNNDEQPIASVDKKSKKATKNDTVSENYYIVAKGENLFSIAKKHHVTVEDLKEWNNLFNTDVKAGTQLVISGESTTKKEQEIATKSDFKEIEYTVAQGDNLSSIAKKHNTTIDKLKELNNLDDNVIKLGQTLVVSKEPVSKTKTKKDKYLADNNKPTIYQVRKGDTLLSISKKFPGVTIADIKKWNKIKNEKIKPGMKLKINS